MTAGGSWSTRKTRLSRSRLRASSALLEGRSVAVSFKRYEPEGNAVVSQANVFSVSGSLSSRIHSGQPSLRDLERVVQVVFVGVGRLPADVEPGLLGGPVGGAQVGDVEPGDFRCQVGGSIAQRTTDRSSGECRGSVVESLTRYWMNRPAGQAVDALAGSVCSADQADQVSSGSPTFPERD